MELTSLDKCPNCGDKVYVSEINARQMCGLWIQTNKVN